MTFNEKIDKLLKTNKLVNSVNGLEKAIKASNGAIQKPMNEGREPGNKVMKKIQDFFGDQWYTIEKNQETNRDALKHSFNTEVIKEAINQSMLEQLYKDLANFDKELDRAWALIDRLVPPTQNIKGITAKDR